MNMFIILLLTLMIRVQNKVTKVDTCYKYNVCDFMKSKERPVDSEGWSIIRYSSINNFNKNRVLLSQYFLAKRLNDTFNIIQIYNGQISDSIYKEFRWSKNWSFEPMKDTCLYFYSQIDLKGTINAKYPIIFGRIFAKLD